MRELVKINRAGLWRPIRSSETSVRKYSGAYPYVTEGGLVMQSTLQEPVIRYAKNYRKFKKDFSLFMFTHESDSAKVEKHFEDVVKKLKQREINETLLKASMSDFSYVDAVYEEKN